jgi:hypothetical protein
MNRRELLRDVGVAAATASSTLPFETCRPALAMSAVRGRSEDICSDRVVLTLQDCDLRMKIFLNPIFIVFWNALPFFKVSERPRGHSQMAFTPY